MAKPALARLYEGFAAFPTPQLTWLYRKLGAFYPAAFLAVELQNAFVITAGTLGLFSFYFSGSTDEYLAVLAIALGLTAVAVGLNLLRTYPLLRPIQRWIVGERSPERSAEAWTAAVSLPFDMIRRDVWIPIFVVVLPACVAGTVILSLSWLAFFPLLAGSLVAVGYGAILHSLALEAGMRPVLVDINHELTPRLSADCGAFSLRLRLMAALPLINLITGLVVAALTNGGGGGGSATLGLDVAIALGVATTLSLELTVMLSKSILRPIADLRRATAAVQRGDYDVKVPVTTGDELGELAASFNQMVVGLAERERIREAFGTYLDKEVAEYILSEGFSEEGVEVDVSLLFCDVRDFTSFAANAEAREVVARLNQLFETIVPLIAAEGGHVDKFIGDGLIAVFGAPEQFSDHADRAVRAACRVASTVNREDNDLQVGVGVNSGHVIAGSIGGAGRLNFSVIGDAVNVASRVESATRDFDHDVLITAETVGRLSEEIDAEPVGLVELKGISEPVELFAPRVEAPAPPPAAAPAATAAAADSDGAPSRSERARRAMRRALSAGR